MPQAESGDSGDLLPGVCALAHRFLVDVQLPSYRCCDEMRAPLTHWFDNRNVALQLQVRPSNFYPCVLLHDGQALVLALLLRIQCGAAANPSVVRCQGPAYLPIRVRALDMTTQQKIVELLFRQAINTRLRAILFSSRTPGASCSWARCWVCCAPGWEPSPARSAPPPARRLAQHS